MFTADPVNGNRKTLLIETGYGLGEAMVAGLMDTDCYQVEDSVIKSKRVPAKRWPFMPHRVAQQHRNPTMHYKTARCLDDEVGELATLAET